MQGSYWVVYRNDNLDLSSVLFISDYESNKVTSRNTHQRKENIKCK